MDELRAVVIGGKGCGKTSLLACMDKSIENISVIRHLSMVRRSGPFELLEQKYRELQTHTEITGTVFSETRDTVRPGKGGMKDYRYAFEYRNQSLGQDLCLTEIPAEYMNTSDAINRIIQSDILILVIDTPAMMEAPVENALGNRIGKYHGLRNLTDSQFDFLRDESFPRETLEKKLVMFVPVKCEKYDREGQLREVNRKIKESYKHMERFFRDNSSCGIIPVKTMGNTDFSGFEKDGRGSLHTVKRRGLVPSWADLVTRMLLQYTFCGLISRQSKRGFMDRLFGKNQASFLGESKLAELKKENGALIDAAVVLAGKSSNDGYELLKDRVKLEICRIRADFNVLMLGPRRVGKSSILASMLHSINSLDLGKINNLSLTGGDEFTRVYLEEKRNDLAALVKIAQKEPERISMLTPATDVCNSYVLEMGYGKEGKSLTINFMDIPGERFMGAQGSPEWLINEVNACQIIIVAIDTPYLMEENGRYNDYCNWSREVLDLFKSARPNGELSRLVMLVPIKCEKYYHENRMEEVRQAVEKKNALLLKYVRERLPKTTVAIIPVLTMGGVVFDRMELPKTPGRIGILRGGRRIPEQENMKYKVYDQDPDFRPRFCEQPMVCLLSFILKNIKNNSMGLSGLIIKMLEAMFPWITALLAKWRKLSKDEELRQMLDQIKNHMVTKEPGFAFLQNPLVEENDPV